MSGEEDWMAAESAVNDDEAAVLVAARHTYSVL
jgi:hypothetical protein